MIPPISNAPRATPLRPQAAPETPLKSTKALRANFFSVDFNWAETIFEITFLEAIHGEIVKQKKSKKSAYWEVEVEYKEVTIIWKCEWRPPLPSNTRGIRGDLAFVCRNDKVSDLAMDNIKATHKEVRVI